MSQPAADRHTGTEDLFIAHTAEKSSSLCRDVAFWAVYKHFSIYIFFSDYFFISAENVALLERKSIENENRVKNELTLLLAGGTIKEAQKGGECRMTLQDRMVNYRAKNRISQGELANLCGVTKQTINSVENGKQEPSRVTLAKIELVVGKEDDSGTINQQD